MRASMRVTLIRALFAIAAAAVSLPAGAGVLPDDRADALYHSYDGGGVEITGPSLLVRKKIGKSFSLSGNYYVDNVTSASIDVVTTASAYTEERTEQGLSVDYLRGGWLMTVAYTNSEESDFTANSAHFSISQDLFGDLTTITLGYSRGWDTVGMSGDPDFSEDNDRQHYRLGLSQVLTKNSILGFAFETITDEGFLNNPYRSVRYVDADSPVGYSYEPEMYPGTRTSNAASLRLKYFLPYRAALHSEYRFFSDTWGIDAHTAGIGYTHPLDNGLTIEASYRFYTQTSADFYSDLFPREQAQNFLARDKELSTFDSQTLSLGLSYEFISKGWHFIDKGTVNLFYDRIDFEYQDFRDLTASAPVGEEPFYELSADVIQLFVSIWF